MDKYIVYSIFVIFLLVLVLLFNYWVKKIINSNLMKFGKKPVHFIIIALLLGLASLTTYHNDIINIIISVTNLFVAEISSSDRQFTVSNSKETEYVSLIGYLIYVSASTWIFTKSYKNISAINASKLKSDIETDNSDAKTHAKQVKSLDKLVLNTLEVKTDPIFQKRIKHLFELKYSELHLSHDSKYNILYGIHKHGLHNYAFVIYCRASKFSVQVSRDEIAEYNDSVKTNISHLISRTYPKIENNLIFNIYYIVERGFFDPNEYDIECLTEDDLLNKLIDFEEYLASLVIDFEESKLPFSTKHNLTLKDSFIPSKFLNRGKPETVDSYIDQWIDEESNRHLVILADYGMGKTSFMRFQAYKMAKEILRTSSVKRFPIFISLTNSSPRHGGIQLKCQGFVATQLGVKYELFQTLIDRGEIVFLLDGFDEMGFIGSHSQRIKQLDALWQLATVNNKLIISGRPSYFPTESKLIQGLNIRDEKDIPRESPYCTRIDILPFDDDDIQKSIETYYPDDVQVAHYMKFIQSHPELLELCQHPSMLHIIREMLPELVENFIPSSASASILMEKFVDHWIDRQFDKKIQSALDNKEEKKEFLIDFYKDLAGIYYDDQNGNISISHEEVKEIANLNAHYQDLTHEETEGLEHELLTAYFIERHDDNYKFVHKSFLEYFVSEKIKNILSNDGYFKQEIANILTKARWSDGILHLIFSMAQNAYTRKTTENKSITTRKKFFKIPRLAYLTPELESGRSSLFINFYLSSLGFVFKNKFIYISFFLIFLSTAISLYSTNSTSSFLTIHYVSFLLIVFLIYSSFAKSQSIKDPPLALRHDETEFDYAARIVTYEYRRMNGAEIIRKTINYLSIVMLTLLGIGVIVIVPYEIIKTFELDSEITHRIVIIYNYLSGKLHWTNIIVKILISTTITIGIILFALFIGHKISMISIRNYSLLAKSYFLDNHNNCLPQDGNLLILLYSNELIPEEVELSDTILSWYNSPELLAGLRLKNIKVIKFLQTYSACHLNKVHFSGYFSKIIFTDTSLRNCSFENLRPLSRSSKIDLTDVSSLDDYSLTELCKFIIRHKVDIDSQILAGPFLKQEIKSFSKAKL